MTPQEAMKELSKIAGDRYHGINHNLAKFSEEREVKETFDLFIEVSHNPNDKDGYKYVNSCHCTELENGLKEIQEQFELEMNIKRKEPTNEKNDTANQT